MSDEFKGRYTVADGYVGQDARPHYFRVLPSDLDSEMSDDELRTFYEETAHYHFEQHVTCEPDREEEFIAWAREQLNKRSAA